MTKREAVHKLVDDLPEDGLAAAERLLEALRTRVDPVAHLFEHAPPDDEPVTHEDSLALADARRDLREQRGIPDAEVNAKHGRP